MLENKQLFVMKHTFFFFFFFWGGGVLHVHLSLMSKPIHSKTPNFFHLATILCRRYDSILRGAWAIFPGAQPTEQPRRVSRLADRGMTFS